MSMLKYFFSIKYQGQSEIFEHLDIWKNEKYRTLQGTYPVVFLSFAGIKEVNYAFAKRSICRVITKLYVEFDYLRSSDVMTAMDQKYWDTISVDMDEVDAAVAIHNLCDYLNHYYGEKAIILLDEYDTPLQEAYVNGYWNELTTFTRSLFNNTFKTNPYLERAVMTGITRVSNTSCEVSESMFSDLNNLNVITMTSNKYASYFGFKEKEIFAAMDEFGLTNKAEVKSWYDGFTIGNLRDIYNPWSIICLLDEKKTKPYWANTSSNSLADRLIRTGNQNIKMEFEDLLQGHSIRCRIDDSYNDFIMDLSWDCW